MRAVRMAAVPVTVVSLAACGSAHRETAPAGHRTTTPPTLRSVSAYLAGSDLVWQQLSKSTAVPVSADRAEVVALGRSTKSSPPGVTASLVRATDTSYCKRLPDGTCRKVIEDRPVWIVLVPNQQVPLTGPPGKSDAVSYWATMAVLVDARTGKYLLAVAVPS